MVDADYAEQLKKLKKQLIKIVNDKNYDKLAKALPALNWDHAEPLIDMTHETLLMYCCRQDEDENLLKMVQLIL